MIERLTAEQLSDTLSTLPDWRYDAVRNALHRQLRLGNFKEALSLMVRIGLEAEAADHHPEWSNVYDRLDIWLTTHDADGVSARDIDLARKIDEISRTRAH